MATIGFIFGPFCIAAALSSANFQVNDIKVTEHLWVLILPKIFLLVSMKALD